MDNLRKYVELRNSLMREKQETERRLQEINAALGEESGASETPSGPRAETGAPQAVVPQQSNRGGRGRRASNGGLSLREAVLQLTAQRAMTKEEILQGVKQLGYKFSTNNPLNSLGVILYGKNPRFKNEQGRFSPAGGSGSPSGGGRGGSATAARPGNGATSGPQGRGGRRQLSPAARERIAAAQRERWAKAKRGK